MSKTFADYMRGLGKKEEKIWQNFMKKGNYKISTLKKSYKEINDGKVEAYIRSDRDKDGFIKIKSVNPSTWWVRFENETSGSYIPDEKILIKIK